MFQPDGIAGAPRFLQVAEAQENFVAPPGFREAPVRYDNACCAASGEAAILDFFQSVYEGAATLANWDRRALERTPPKGARR